MMRLWSVVLLGASLLGCSLSSGGVAYEDVVLRVSLIVFLYYALLSFKVVEEIFSGESGRSSLYQLLWTALAPLLYMYVPRPILYLYSVLISVSAPAYAALESLVGVLLAENVSRSLNEQINSSDDDRAFAAKAAVIVMSLVGIVLSYEMHPGSVPFAIKRARQFLTEAVCGGITRSSTPNRSFPKTALCDIGLFVHFLS
jgi:hypothetical protein